MTHYSDVMNQSTYRYKLSLIVIPLALLIIGLIYIKNSGLYFLRSVDPEYGYLLNGAALACFKSNIQFITNPGIPVHFLSAIVCAAVHLFRPGMPLLDDVVVNPELYIRAIIYTVNGINTISLFILGLVVYRFTRNTVTSMFLQLMAFTNLLTIEVTARLLPEALMLVITTGWVIVIIAQLNNHKLNYSLLYGFLISLAITDKLTYLPYIFIPLFLLETWKKKFRFILYAIGFFVILGYPLFLNDWFFKDWVVGIIGHTGPYGSGEAGFAIASEFFSHLKSQINNTPFLFGGMILLFIAGVLYKFLTNQPDQLITRLSASLVLLIIGQYLIASKQFAFHYMIPSILLTPLVFYVLFTIPGKVFPLRISRSIPLVIAAAGIIILTRTTIQMQRQMHDMRESSMQKAVVYEEIIPYLKAKPLIVSPSYYGCSSIEYALTYGIHVSGKNSGFLYKTIQKHYPDVYMYFPWGDTFYKGNLEVKPPDFFNTGLEYRLYMADYDETKINMLIQNLESHFSAYRAEKSVLDSAGSDMILTIRMAQARSLSQQSYSE